MKISEENLPFHYFILGNLLFLMHGFFTTPRKMFQARLATWLPMVPEPQILLEQWLAAWKPKVTQL